MIGGPPWTRIEECDDDQLAMAALLGCDPATAPRSYCTYYVEVDGHGRVEERPQLHVIWRDRTRLICPGGVVQAYTPARPIRRKPALRIVDS